MPPTSAPPTTPTSNAPTTPTPTSRGSGAAPAPEGGIRPSGPVVDALLRAILDRDPVALAGLLAPDVWFRAMLVHEVVEYHDPASTVKMFLGWFHRAVELEVVESTTAPALTREFLRYRVRLRPDWAPDVWHTIEQSGYARVADGRIRRLDLVCTGFVPDQPGASQP
jgi:hypothetical protein